MANGTNMADRDNIGEGCVNFGERVMAFRKIFIKFAIANQNTILKIKQNSYNK